MPKLRFVLVAVCLILSYTVCVRRVEAALMQTYDVDSLVYMSDDIVEARLVRHHRDVNPAYQDTFTATVKDTIAGKLKPGDIIPLDLAEYLIRPTDDHFFVFISRHGPVNLGNHQTTPHLVPSGLIMIDSFGRAHRYFQFDNPGGYCAEGTTPWDDESKALDNPALPTFAQERATIDASVTFVAGIRPLLERKATRADVPQLTTLLQSRPRLQSAQVGDAIAAAAIHQLTELNDPAVIIDAFASTGYPVSPDRYFLPILYTPQGRSYLLRVLGDTSAPTSRRIVAAAFFDATTNTGDPGLNVAAIARGITILCRSSEPRELRKAMSDGLWETSCNYVERPPLPTATPLLRDAYGGTVDLPSTDRYRVDCAILRVLGPKAYQALHTACGGVISEVNRAEMRSNLPNKTELEVNYWGEVTKDTPTQGMALEFRVESRKSGFSFSIPCPAGDEFNQPVGRLERGRAFRGLVMLRLATPLKTGSYTVSTQVRVDGKVVSRGYPSTFNVL